MGLNERTFKYSTFTIQIFSIFPFLCFILAVSYFKIKKANLLFMFFLLCRMWYLNYWEYLKVWNSTCECSWKIFFFFLLRWTFLKTPLICYDLNRILMNVLQESINYFSSGKPSSFIMIFIIHYKTATMTAQQFYKQPSFYWLLRQCVKLQQL